MIEAILLHALPNWSHSRRLSSSLPMQALQLSNKMTHKSPTTPDLQARDKVRSSHRTSYSVSSTSKWMVSTLFCAAIRKSLSCSCLLACFRQVSDNCRDTENVRCLLLMRLLVCLTATVWSKEDSMFCMDNIAAKNKTT